MRYRFSVAGACLCALAFAALLALPARTQPASEEKPVMYTYVAEWAVPRAMWGDYDKVQAAQSDTMKNALADGTLVSYGGYEILNHQEGLPTHGTWFSAHSMAGILKTLGQLRSSPNSVSAPLAASKHWDYILESRDYNSHSGTFTNGFLRVSHWADKPGAGDSTKVQRATMVAMLEKLLAEGAIHGYQIDRESIHSQDPGNFYVAIITNGAEGLDKFYAALDENEKNNPALLAAFGSTIDPHGHTDFLARIPSMSHK